jgi:hypothetical protein
VIDNISPSRNMVKLSNVENDRVLGRDPAETVASTDRT